MKVFRLKMKVCRNSFRPLSKPAAPGKECGVMKYGMIRTNLDKSKTIAEFKQRAQEKSFILGNYFLELAAVGDSTLCPYLRNLKVEKGWGEDDHMGRWVNVLCAYLEDGGEGIVRFSRAANIGQSYIGMCLDVLSTKQSSENLALMADVIPLKFRLPTNPREFETASGWCRAIVNALSSESRVNIDKETESRLRRFAHNFLKKGVRKMVKTNNFGAGDVFYMGPGLELLSYVGNHESIELIQSLPQRSAFVQSTAAKVIHEIRSREGRE
jgi:hypothetical protein